MKCSKIRIVRSSGLPLLFCYMDLVGLCGLLHKGALFAVGHCNLGKPQGLVQCLCLSWAVPARGPAPRDADQLCQVGGCSGLRNLPSHY